ncbi:hypothetical protein D3C86_1098110 [compost metagenome]
MYTPCGLATYCVPDGAIAMSCPEMGQLVAGMLPTNWLMPAIVSMPGFEKDGPWPGTVKLMPLSI